MTWVPTQMLQLCYTRGTTIPCALIIECGDPQALEILSSPEAVVLRLRRNVRFHTGEKTAAHYGDVASKLVWKEELDHSELASWWPAADRALETNSTDAIAINAFRRMLKGEIHLREDLIASSSVAHFRIEVCIFRVIFCFTLMLRSIQWCYSHSMLPAMSRLIANPS